MIHINACDVISINASVGFHKSICTTACNETLTNLLACVPYVCDNTLAALGNQVECKTSVCGNFMIGCHLLKSVGTATKIHYGRHSG